LKNTQFYSGSSKTKILNIENTLGLSNLKIDGLVKTHPTCRRWLS